MLNALRFFFSSRLELTFFQQNLNKIEYFGFFRLIAAAFAVAINLSSCRCSEAETKNGLSPQAYQGSAADSTKLELEKKGRSVYNSICITCHNSNPKIAGSLGPDIWGSSKELIEAKVLHGTYPAGYKPKRNSQVMAKLSLTALQIEAIAAYLNSSN
jgi:cytochrome c2